MEMDIEKTGEKEAGLHPKDLFSALIQNSSDIISILKPDGTIHYESPSIERLLGYSPDELIGKKAFRMVHPDDLSRVMDAFSELIRDPMRSLSLTFRYKHKNGLWRMIESTGSNQLLNPVIAGIVVNSRDVTERRRTEEERENLIRKLNDALAKIKTLKGLLPICAWCKKIRDDGGYWKKVETYIKEHSEAFFTHCICPECLKKESPETYDEVSRERGELLGNSPDQE